MTETLSEESTENESRRLVGMLVYIGTYDDLSVDRSFALPALGPGNSSHEIGRGVEGGAPSCEHGRLLLPDRYVSSRHATVKRIGIADHLEDLDSKHHTFVNGRQVDSHILTDGDLIEMGHSLLVYRQAELGLANLMSARREIRLGPTRTLSPDVAQLVFDLDRLAKTNEPMLLLGERGTGKEIVANHVHDLSGRKPFLAIDCGAVTETLFESEFFGHERDTFPGAKRRHGYLRTAHGGTLFLDEIGNLPLRSQERLLRAVQTNAAIPVGSDKPISFDVRWMSATNSDIFDESRFRPDLRDRLARYTGRLPPLRQRREDLGILTAHILGELGTPTKGLTKRAARFLLGGPLPGNIRSLRSTLRTAAILANGDLIDLEHLGLVETKPETLRRELPRPESAPATDIPAQGPHPTVEQIRVALQQTGGNQTRAAAILGTNPRQLYRWLRELSISIDEFRH